MPINRYWKTNSLYLAAYLFVKGVDLVGVQLEGGEEQFSFRESLERELWTEEYEKEEAALVDARLYAWALQYLAGLRDRASEEHDARTTKT